MMHASVKRSRSFNALEHVCTHGTLAAMLKSFTCLSRSLEVGLSAFSNAESLLYRLAVNQVDVDV